MTTGVDYYDLLGVDSTADTKQITTAAAALLKSTHPDRTGSSAAAHLTGLVLEARNTLTNATSRATYDASRGNSSTSPTVPSSDSVQQNIHPLLGGFSAYLVSKIIERLNDQHHRYVDTSPGTIAVNPLVLLHGESFNEGTLSWTVEPGSRPGDRVQVIQDGRVIDVAHLSLEPAVNGVYYSDGLPWCVMYVSAERMMQGGTVQSDTMDDITVPVPPGSGMYTIVESSGLMAVLVNMKIRPFMDDEDVLDNMSRLLD